MPRSMLMLCATAVLFSAGALACTVAVSADRAIAVPYAKVSLDAAVATAENYAHGNAGCADYEKQTNGQWVYEIEVRKGPKVFDVKVDAEKGTIIASTEAQAGAGDQDDKAD
jgi:hypothetical protein